MRDLELILNTSVVGNLTSEMLAILGGILSDQAQEVEKIEEKQLCGCICSGFFREAV